MLRVVGADSSVLDSQADLRSKTNKQKRGADLINIIMNRFLIKKKYCDSKLKALN